MRKSVIVLASAVFAVVTIAAPALAGGQPKPAPGWIGPFIIGACKPRRRGRGLMEEYDQPPRRVSRSGAGSKLRPRSA